MAAAIGLRSDYTADALMGLAKASRDAKQTRRLLALSAIYDGESRTQAARIGGVGLQIVSACRSSGEEDQETVQWTVSPTNGCCGSMPRGRRG